MSHGHSHPVEENPKVTSTGALYFVLLIVGLVLGLFLFVQSMSGHHDDGHGDEHATEHHQDGHSEGGKNEDKGHSWASTSVLEYSSVALSGGKVHEAKEEAPVIVVSTPADSAAAKTPAVSDSVKVEKK